jgi:serine/threonine protein kinase
LTDFGLSKDNLNGQSHLTNSFCGTTEYLAPEIIKSKDGKASYGKMCDWWSYGCVIYEMLTSSPPFYGK